MAMAGGAGQRNSPAASIARYTSSNMLKHVLGLFTALVKPRLLSPELYGLLNFLNVIPTYSSYSNLGSYDMMRYKVPYLRARGETDKSRVVEDSVFYGSLLTTGCIVLGLVAAALLGGFSATVKTALPIVAVFVAVTWYHDNYVVLLKAHQEFRLLSLSILLKAVASLVCAASLIYLFALYGALCAPIVALVPVLIYLRRRHPVRRRGTFEPQVFLGLVRQGLPLMLYNFGAVLLNTTDRIVIALMLGNEQLGYYGIAILLFGFLRQIPGTAREVLEPHLMERLSSDTEEVLLKDYLFGPLLHTAYLMPLLLGPAVILLPVAVPLVLPRYTPGIGAAQLIVFSCYFLALTYVARGIIVARSWQVTGAVLMAAAVGLNILLSAAFVRLGFGITGVAAASVLSQGALLLLVLALLRARCGCAPEEWRKTLWGVGAAFAAMAAIIALLQALFRGGVVNLYADALLQTALFCAAFGAVIFAAGKVYPAISNIVRLRF